MRQIEVLKMNANRTYYENIGELIVKSYVLLEIWDGDRLRQIEGSVRKRYMNPIVRGAWVKKSEFYVNDGK